MARQPRRRKKKHGEPFKTAGAVLLVLLTLGAAAWGLFVWATAAPPIVRSSDTLCPTTGHTGVFVILLDATDALPEPAKNHVFTLLTEQIEALPENALLDLRVLDPKFVGGRQLAALCNPGDGRGLSEFTANPLLAQKRWRERFREPLLRELKGGLQPSPTKTSPLLATFQGIALDRFTGTRTNQRPKRFTIVSDLLEHSPPEYSQYPPGDLRYERFKSIPLYRKVRTDLNGAEVEIFYVQRLFRPPIDTGKHIQFWLDWITDNSGRFVKATKLQGAE